MKSSNKKLKLFLCPRFTTNMLDPKDPNLEPPTVLVMLPCYGGQMTVQTVESLLELQLEGYERGIDFVFVFDTKCSLISLGRSVMLSDVYNNFQDWTHILWVDADIGFTIDDFFKLLVADKDIIGGYYPLKSYPIKWASSQNKINEGKEEGDLIETFYIATGFTLVKKQVIDKMLEHFKEEKRFRYWDREFVHLFEPIIDKENDDWFLSEDYAFCKRAREVGFVPWMHRGVRLSHTGSHTFSLKGEEELLDKYQKANKIKESST